MNIVKKILSLLCPVCNDKWGEWKEKHNYHIDMKDWTENKKKGTISKCINEGRIV